MWKKDNVTGQQTAWLLAAASGPMLSLIGKNAAGDVLAAALLCGVLCLAVMRCTAQPGKWVSLLQILSTVLYLGSIAGESATCWSHTGNLPIIPWTLLALAAVATQEGGDKARRTGSVLLWLVMPIIGIVFLAGGGELNFSDVRTMNGRLPWELIPLFLLPCLHYYSTDRKTKIMGRVIWFPGILTVVGAFWLDAAFGGSVAEQHPNAFYEYSRGITLFGIAERFEALVGCALTVGWFGFFSFLLGITYASGERLGKGRGKSVVWSCAATTGLVMWKMHIPVELAGILSLISWVFLPILTQILEKAKNVNKASK